MTVTEFFEKYNGDTSELNIRTYVPIQEKLNIINQAVLRIVKTDDRFTATYNSVTAEIAKEIAAMSAYTGLVFESLEDYDRIIDTGVLDQWFDTRIIRSKDVEDFRYYFDMRLQDAIRDANSIDGIVNRVMNTLGEAMGTLDPEMIGRLLHKVIGE